MRHRSVPWPAITLLTLAASLLRSEAAGAATEWWTTTPPAGMAALCDLSAADGWYGEPTGLYQGVSNSPNQQHQQVLTVRGGEVRPLSASGAADSQRGLIGMVAIGFSNTTQIWGAFERDAAELGHNGRVVLANLAVAGHDARIQAGEDLGDPFPFCLDWQRAHPEAPEDACADLHAAHWEAVDERLAGYGLSPAQVQVVWLYTSLDAPDSELNATRTCTSGGRCWRSELQELRDAMFKVVFQHLPARFPNLRVVLVSSMPYGGFGQETYAPPTQEELGTNPEPFSFETGFAVRWLMDRQTREIAAAGGPAAYLSSGRPVIAWGPYGWASGAEARDCLELPYELSPLAWQIEEFEPDFSHPSEGGESALSSLLFGFLQHSAETTRWFTPPLGDGSRMQVVPVLHDTATDGEATFGGDELLPVGGAARIFLKFDPSQIDPEREILYAKLVLRSAPGDLEHPTTVSDLAVDRVAPLWSEASTAAELASVPVRTSLLAASAVLNRGGSLGVAIDAALRDAVSRGQQLAVRVSAEQGETRLAIVAREYAHPARLFGDGAYLVVVSR